MRTFSLLFAVLSTLMTFAQSPLSSPKNGNVNNPLNAFNFCADPTSVEYDGRVYVYGTNDNQEFAVNGFAESNTYGKINTLVCMSSADLVNWTWHQPIDVKKAAPWTGCSWAPSICSRVEADGKTHFYLYFANGASGIGVLTSTSPTGPWKDPLGKALVAPGDDENKYHLGGIVWLFDPGVCVDENGVGWLAYGGGGEPNKVGNALIDGNTRLVKLADDMIHFDGTPIVLPAPYHFEASELNIIGGKFVYTYCSNWSGDRSQWGEFTQYDHSKSKPAAPGVAKMCYMTSTDPLNPSSWMYEGSYVDNPGSFGYPTGNNHTHLQKFNNAYYLFYHHEAPARAINGEGKGYRSIGANKLIVDEANCKLSNLTMSDAGATQIKANRPVITDLQQAEMIWNASGIDFYFGGRTTLVTAVVPKQAGSWTAVRQAYTSSEVTSFVGKLRGKGKMEIRLDDITAEPIGTVEFNTNSFKEYSIHLNSSFKGLHTIYFVFTEVSNTLTAFDEWQFFVEDITGLNSAEAAATVVGEEYYTVSGTKCQTPTSGLYVVKQKLSDGRTVSEKVVRK